MIYDTVSYLKEKGLEVIYDAEHFFDGFKENEDYALSIVKDLSEQYPDDKVFNQIQLAVEGIKLIKDSDDRTEENKIFNEALSKFGSAFNEKIETTRLTGFLISRVLIDLSIIKKTENQDIKNEAIRIESLINGKTEKTLAG